MSRLRPGVLVIDRRIITFQTLTLSEGDKSGYAGLRERLVLCRLGGYLDIDNTLYWVYRQPDFKLSTAQ